MSDDPSTFKQGAEDLHGPPGSEFGAKDLLRPVLAPIAKYWWVELLIGVVWLVLAVVVLHFNHASVVTVGVLTGVLFLLYALEEFALATLDTGARWLWIIFGVLLTVGGILALIHPQSTFVAFADILGFVFLMVGIFWMIQAFYERVINSLWWLGLISGILMVGLAFWVSDKALVERAYTLLLFVGIWAAMKGVTDIIRAFQIRALAS